MKEQSETNISKPKILTVKSSAIKKKRRALSNDVGRKTIRSNSYCGLTNLIRDNLITYECDEKKHFLDKKYYVNNSFKMRRSNSFDQKNDKKSFKTKFKNYYMGKKWLVTGNKLEFANYIRL